jgi:hypothetical protein
MALHCTMTYYGEEDHGAGLPATWYHYLVIASPGPKAGSGLASILTLSQAKGKDLASGPSHTILTDAGGPEAALERAEHFLDSQHHGLKKILSRRQG